MLIDEVNNECDHEPDDLGLLSPQHPEDSFDFPREVIKLEKQLNELKGPSSLCIEKNPDLAISPK